MLALRAGYHQSAATVLGLPGLTYLLEQTADYHHWETVTELREAQPAGDPEQPVLLEQEVAPAGSLGVMRLRL